ncbi:MAG: esterase [Acidobacteria bacterium]|nr:esterase [Acidobacteriota bacterium]
MQTRTLPRMTLAVLATFSLAVVTFAQEAQEPPRFPTPQGPQVTSPEVHEDGRISFRILAPKAEAVRLGGTDIPPEGGSGANPMVAFQGRPMNKGEKGIWELTVGPLEPGAYRYQFVVDGVNVVDPRNPATSESNENAWSLVYVPGAEFMDTRDVPRGSVAEVTYYSKALKRFRRMHVYTPPGYESGEGRFPVLYLLHGAFDCDDSWTSVGRAGFILDNLIAAGKAEPMVVAMPAGHTGPFHFGMPLPEVGEFSADFTGDVMPWIESHYRVHADRAHRALAGLSMGGGQTLNIAIRDLERYGYLGVFSSGVFGITGQGPGARPGEAPWTERHADALNDAAAREGLKLVWFATGKEDFLLETSRATVAALREHGFEVVFKETDGGHTWKNWREYLNEFAPQLFR